MKNRLSASQTLPRRMSIPRIEGFSVEDFRRDYREPGKAVIITGALDAWPAMKTWNPEFFKEKYGDREVSATHDLVFKGVSYERPEKDHRSPMKVREVVERITSGKSCYIDKGDLAFFPSLEKDFDFEEFIGPDPGHIDCKLWLGAITRTGMHYDMSDNFHAQIFGEKNVMLLSPESSAYLYPFGGCIVNSQVDPAEPDLDKFPKFARTTVYEATLQPGDMLFLPKGWWHYFRTFAPSISINCWHGGFLTAGYQARVVNAAGLHLWFKIMSDFFWYGFLRRPYKTRLYYDGPPTGMLLYQLVRTNLSHFFKKR